VVTGESDVSERDGPVSSPVLPTVSIILPVLNEEAQLERCLRAVAEQSYPSIIEVVVADGGSTDGTDQWYPSSQRCVSSTTRGGSALPA